MKMIKQVQYLKFRFVGYRRGACHSVIGKKKNNLTKKKFNSLIMTKKIVLLSTPGKW